MTGVVPEELIGQVTAEIVEGTNGQVEPQMGDAVSIFVRCSRGDDALERIEREPAVMCAGSLFFI